MINVRFRSDTFLLLDLKVKGESLLESGLQNRRVFIYSIFKSN